MHVAIDIGDYATGVMYGIDCTFGTGTAARNPKYLCLSWVSTTTEQLAANIRAVYVILGPLHQQYRVPKFARIIGITFLSYLLTHAC